MSKLTGYIAASRTLLIGLMLILATTTQSSAKLISEGPTQHVPIAESPSAPLQVEVVDAPTLDKESQDVLDTLEKLLQGLARRDLDAVAACLSDNVTQINQQNKVIYGKLEVLENVKKNIIGSNNENPVKRITVYSPFVRIKGDTAMVSFRATKEMSGSRPDTLESWCSEVFERKDGKWLVLELKTSWKLIHSKL